MNKIDYKAMGAKIRAKREEFKLTQEKLSEIVNISPSHMGEIERGETTCSLVVIVNIAIALELNLDTLVRGIDERNVNTALLDILEEVPKDKQKTYVTICESVAQGFKNGKL